MFSQKLKSLTVNSLGTDAQHLGRILDVKYISELDMYIVAGDFTSFNGFLSQNLVFLDGALNPIANSGLQSCDGPINSIEFVKNSPTNYSLWIGGAFNTFQLNNTGTILNRNLIAELTLTITNASPVSFSTSVQIFNPIPLGSGTVVNDIEYLEWSTNKRLIVGGLFNEVTDFNSSSTILSTSNLCSVNLNTTQRTRSVSSNSAMNSQIYSIEEIPGSLGRFVYSTSQIINSKTTNSKTYLCSAGSLNTNISSFDHKSPSLATIFTNYASPRIVLNGNQIHRNDQMHFIGFEGLNPEKPRRTSVTLNALSNGFINFDPHIEDYLPNNIQYYNESAYSTSPFLNDFLNPYCYHPQILTLSKYDQSNNRSGFGYLGATTSLDLDYDTTKLYKQDELIISGKYLFYTSPNLIGLSSYYTVTDPNGGSLGRIAVGTAPTANIIALENPVTPRQNMAVFCLEPKKINQFINPDIEICSGNELSYTVNKSQFANGYLWNFSGSGMLKVKSSPSNAYENFNLNYNTIDSIIYVQVQDGFTGGVLTVRPYLFCNGVNDTIYGNSLSISLSAAPLPNLQLADSLSLNCLEDTLHLVASSSTPNVSYTWENEFDSIINNDSIQLSLTSVTSVTFPRYFIATIKENSGNMCSTSDSVFVDRSVIAPELALNSSLPIWNCYTDSLQVTVTDTNGLAPELPIIYAWNYLDSTYSIPDMLTITNPNDSIAFLATYASNGCKDTAQFFISADLQPPVQQIEGFSFGFQTVGTITCSNDSLLVVLADYNGIDSDNFWIYQGDTIQDSLWVTINDPSYIIADSINANLVTVTIDEYRFNPTNGCSNFNALAAVIFDVKHPSVIPYTGTNSLTCSDTALQLYHTPTFGITNQGWLLPNGTSNNADSIIATSAGNYVYAVEGANGCLNYDTVNVIQTTDLLFVSQPDTLVCPGSNFSLSAQAIGPGTMTYSWSNGLQTTSPNGIGGVDTLFIVQASNGLGCSGVDSLFARVTAPIEATFEAFSSCGAGGFIQVDSIYGGAAADINDYLFAFNGETFSSNYSFPVPELGTYPLLIKDTLNCEYAFQTTITGVIQTPEANFLVSTYNQIGDTIALVNITDFSGFDGVFWTFPANLDVVSSYDSIAIFTAADSGWYNIEFTGYILDTSVSPADTCFYPFQKTVYFGNYAINYGDSVVDNSISNVILFPNPINAGQAQTVTLSFTIASLQHYEVLFVSSNGSVFPSVSDEGDEVGEVVRTFNLPALAAGTYVFHILAEYGAKQVKLIVQ